MSPKVGVQTEKRQKEPRGVQFRTQRSAVASSPGVSLLKFSTAVQSRKPQVYVNRNVGWVRNIGGKLTEREKDVSRIPAMSQTGRCESGLGQNGWRC